MEEKWGPVLGLFAMLGGSFCFSLMALVAAELGSGRASEHKFEPFELVFWRSLFMLAITMSSTMSKGLHPLGPACTRTRVILVIRGLCGVAFMATYYYSLAVLPMSDAVVLTYTSPMLTALAATVFLGEAWHSLDFFGSGLCLAGVMMISKPPALFHLLGLQDEQVELPPLGLAAASAAAVSATCVYVIIRILKARGMRRRSEGAKLAALTPGQRRALPGLCELSGNGRCGDCSCHGLGTFWRELGYSFSAGLDVAGGLGCARVAGGNIVGLRVEGGNSGKSHVNELPAGGGGKQKRVKSKAWYLSSLNPLHSMCCHGESGASSLFTALRNIQVVFAFIFQRTLLHESSSDFASKLGALMISLWGVVALTKEACAQAAVPSKETEQPLLEKRRSPTLSPGLLAMIIGAFFFSLMALLVKLLSGFGTYELVFWRSVFMFIGTMSMLGAKRINPLGPPGSRVLLWVRAAAGFGFMSGYYYAIQHLPLSDAVVITYTSPVITAIAAALLLGEAWSEPGIKALDSAFLMA